MEKARFIRFIEKYHLAGSVESTKLVVNNNTLKTDFISNDKTLVGSVEMSQFDYDDVELGIYDTTKLLKMLSVLSDDISFNTKGSDSKLYSIHFKDQRITANYMLADFVILPKVPTLKTLPDWDVEIAFDQPLIEQYIKSKSALSSEKYFTVLSNQDGTVDIVIGHSDTNSNRLTLKTGATVSTPLQPISFSADYLKEILAANKEAKEATLKVSADGLSNINFKIDDFKCEYYLMQQRNTN